MISNHRNLMSVVALRPLIQVSLYVKRNWVFSNIKLSITIRNCNIKQKRKREMLITLEIKLLQVPSQSSIINRNQHYNGHCKRHLKIQNVKLSIIQENQPHLLKNGERKQLMTS